MWQNILDVATFIGGIVALVTVVSVIWKYGPVAVRWISAFHDRHNVLDRDRELVGTTYYKYRDVECPALTSRAVVEILQERYHCDALVMAGVPLPVTVLWSNHGDLVSPDELLGSFDDARPQQLPKSAVFGEADYKAARDFIKRQYEAPPSEVKYEGLDYRMVSIDIDPKRKVPAVNGAFGYYYDNILTQYALEWELKKALLDPSVGSAGLSRPGSLPLREAVEAAAGNPLLIGAGRCAAITISMLVVFMRADRAFCTVLSRRSEAVGVSAGLHHVVPAGMFEAPNSADPWSLEGCFWRELLEEMYDEREQIGTGRSEIKDYLRGQPPVDLLLRLIQAGQAELSVTGVCCDLLTLRTEVCAVLYVPTPELAEARPMRLNWEYEDQGQKGSFAVRWSRLPQLADDLAARGDLVVSGAACIALGRQWLTQRHSL